MQARWLLDRFKFEETMDLSAETLQGLCHAGKETCSRHVAGGYIDVQALQLSAEGALGPWALGNGQVCLREFRRTN